MGGLGFEMLSGLKELGFMRVVRLKRRGGGTQGTTLIPPIQHLAAAVGSSRGFRCVLNGGSA